MTEPNKTTVRRLITELVNEKRYEIAPDLIAENYVRHEPGTPAEPGGPDEFVSMLETLHEGFPDLEMSIDGVIAEGDLVSFYATEHGTHEGRFMGLEPTGREIEITGNVTHRLADGKIVETWATFDWMTALEQLGAIEGIGDETAGGT